jgi:hypothetical protein
MLDDNICAVNNIKGDINVFPKYTILYDEVRTIPYLHPISALGKNTVGDVDVL